MTHRISRLAGCFAASVAALLAVAGVASSHPVHGDTVGLWAGAGHPLAGWDHILAALTVGLWSVQRTGRCTLLTPSAFVLGMMSGTALALLAIPLPAVESSIAVSVVVLGALLASARELPTGACALIAAAFAVFHGHAHGTELSGAASPIGWSTGLLASTAALIFVGLAAGATIRQTRFSFLSRLAGFAASMCGVALLLG